MKLAKSVLFCVCAGLFAGMAYGDTYCVQRGTVDLSVTSSYTTLSGVKCVGPENGAVINFAIEKNDTRTFNAPINYNGGYGCNTEDVRCYGKVGK